MCSAPRCDSILELREHGSQSGSHIPLGAWTLLYSHGHNRTPTSLTRASRPQKVGPSQMEKSQNPTPVQIPRDRKSTRLNSSHVAISYAVFCLKKKKQNTKTHNNKTAKST